MHQALVRIGASCCLVGLLGLGLGAIIRHAAASIVVLVGGVRALAQIAGKLVNVAKYAPVHIVDDSLSTP